MLVLGAEGVAPAVRRQLSEMERLCKKNSAEFSERMNDNDYGCLVDALTGLCYPACAAGSALSLRVDVPCRDITGMLERIRVLETECGAASLSTAHVAGGLVYSHFLSLSESDSIMNVGRIIAALTDAFPRSNIVVIGLSGHDSAGTVPFFLGNRAPASWLESIKTCFDPANLMNPGIQPC